MSAPTPWGTDRRSDEAAAAAIWKASNEVQRSILETLATVHLAYDTETVARPLEELAAACGTGVIAFAQAVGGIETLCAMKGRSPCIAIEPHSAIPIRAVSTDGHAIAAFLRAPALSWESQPPAS